MTRIKLDNRGVLRISGEDRKTFLQGLVSNDVDLVDGGQAVYSALLTPQGKFLYDFFIVAAGDTLLLDCRAEDAAALAKRLTMFKLRAKADVADVSSDFDVYALIGDGAAETHATATGLIVYADPRLPAAGARVLAPKDTAVDVLGGEEGTVADYQSHRIALGLPEAPIDLQSDKSILLESGFDELNGVDWDKGCYMGQELTARTKYRGLVKKRLVPVRLDSAGAQPGTDVMADGKVVGDLRSVAGNSGIAMLRLDTIRSGKAVDVNGIKATPMVPAWMQLPEPDNVQT